MTYFSAEYNCRGFRPPVVVVSNNLLVTLVTQKMCFVNNGKTQHKAFDKVPHQRLLLKLKAHGVDGLVCNWIKAWLADTATRVS